MRRSAFLVIAIVVLTAAGIGIWRFLRVSPPPAGSLERLASERLSAATATWTLPDIARHASSEDCWTAVSGGVYDLTAFIPQHPGGRAILPACGTDGTALFSLEPAHTRARALEVMDAEYRIGTLAQ